MLTRGLDFSVLAGYSYQENQEQFISFNVDSLQNNLYGLARPSIGTYSVLNADNFEQENRLTSSRSPWKARSSVWVPALCTWKMFLDSTSGPLIGIVTMPLALFTTNSDLTESSLTSMTSSWTGLNVCTTSACGTAFAFQDFGIWGTVCSVSSAFAIGFDFLLLSAYGLIFAVFVALRNNYRNSLRR